MVLEALDADCRDKPPPQHLLGSLENETPAFWTSADPATQDKGTGTGP